MAVSSSSSTTGDRQCGRAAAWISTGAWCGIFALAIATRLPFLVDLPGTPDGARLIRSLSHFDILEFSPQFPGYPLAVALVRLLPIDGAAAWSAAGACAGASLALVVGLVFRGAFGRAAGLGAGVAVAVWPFLVAQSLRVATDTLVLPALLLGLAAAAGRSSAWGGAIAGLATGLRPSSAPLLGGLLVSRRPGRAGAGLAMGVALWLLPTLAAVGPLVYLQEGVRFARGHFFEWGETALAPQAAPLPAESATAPASTPPPARDQLENTGRALRMLRSWVLRPLGAAGGPGWAVALAGLAAGVLALRFPASRSPAQGHGEYRDSARPLLALVAGSAGHALFISVAQHPDHARHALPIASLLIALAGAGWARLLASLHGSRARTGRVVALRYTMWVATAGALIWCVASSLESGWTRAHSPPPTIRAARALSQDPAFDPLLDRVYTRDCRALIELVASHWDIRQVADPASIAADVQGLPSFPRRVWWLGSPCRAVPGPGGFTVYSDPNADWGARIALGEIEVPVTPSGGESRASRPPGGSRPTGERRR